MDSNQPARSSFRAVLTRLPPSINDAYVKRRFGMVPSDAMKAFLAFASAELLRQVRDDMPVFDRTKPHRLQLEMFLPELYNSSWPKKSGNRFKRRDASNLVKIVEDLIAKAVGIDDSCFITSNVTKFNGPDYGFEGVRALVTELDDKEVLPCI